MSPNQTESTHARESSISDDGWDHIDESGRYLAGNRWVEFPPFSNVDTWGVLPRLTEADSDISNRFPMNLVSGSARHPLPSLPIKKTCTEPIASTPRVGVPARKSLFDCGDTPSASFNTAFPNASFSALCPLDTSPETISIGQVRKKTSSIATKRALLLDNDQDTPSKPSAKRQRRGGSSVGVLAAKRGTHKDLGIPRNKIIFPCIGTQSGCLESPAQRNSSELSATDSGTETPKRGRGRGRPRGRGRGGRGIAGRAK